MLKRGSTHLRALSVNESQRRGQRNSLLRPRQDLSICLDMQKNSALHTTTDTEDNMSTKITRNKVSLSTLISNKNRRERPSFSNKTPIRVTRDMVILPSFTYQKQRQGDVTPNRIEISDFSYLQTTNQGLERRGSAGIRDNQLSQMNYPFSRKAMELSNNLFQLNASKASLHDKQKETFLCPPKVYDMCDRTISSFHREQSVSILSRSRTKVFDSVRASNSAISSADLSDRLKEIDDLNELIGDMESQRVQTDFFNYTSIVVPTMPAVGGEKKIMKSKKKLESLQTESNSDRKQYSNLSQLLDTEDSVDRVILPKLFTPKVSTSTNTERISENNLKENFKKMINKGIGKDPQCKMDPFVMRKINQDGFKFQRKLRHLTNQLHVK